jgi:hypothetical protein
MQQAQATPEPIVVGRWYETVNKNNEWEGCCGKCGKVVPAVQLVPYRLPFGRGERWQCKSGC